MKPFSYFLFAALALSAFSSIAADDAKPAAAKAEAPKAAKPDLAKADASYAAVCLACHGVDGNSAITANPKASDFKQIPGPLVPVTPIAPPNAAPIVVPIAAISSSA